MAKRNKLMQSEFGFGRLEEDENVAFLEDIE
jgi:hypothetical protein